eukprot:gnl/MRDRNA2_/MRDRNA2_90736_c0_seq1.p1 gnl/MRDRNA2_/MRDRNA2_90736_c0~~gnl/MRDRNA2_/MRDRNA2_90736_c0_seq1.p1  ORF type:complete len:103 (-),score=1.81 gnl/MRDRNA2_/MRDRNA2_90736_c0_seq1:44-331(-)
MNKMISTNGPLECINHFGSYGISLYKCPITLNVKTSIKGGTSLKMQQQGNNTVYNIMKRLHCVLQKASRFHIEEKVPMEHTVIHQSIKRISKGIA